MIRRWLLACIVGVVAVGAPTRVLAQGVEGSWKLSYITTTSFESTAAIVKLKVDGGKTTGEIVAGSPRIKNLVLKSVAQEGGTLRIVLQAGTSELVFAAQVPKQAAKEVKGSVSIDGAISPAMLTSTEDAALTVANTFKAVNCPPLTQARTLSNKSLTLRFQAQQSKDPDKKKDLLKQAAEADQAAKKETPKLYREVLEKFADSPAVFEATLALMRTAQSSETKTEEVKSWATTATKAAKNYGPRWQAEYAAQIATVLVGQEGFAPLALDYATQAERALSAKASAGEQVRVLGLVARALRKTGKDDDAKKYDVRVAKLDEVLDREYSEKMPPFKGTAFKGRTSKSERAVFMELFTGAMCPPCVAADLAFDVLQKTYKPSELVLIQYHMHIPGPDPMTNPDTEARWSYYTKAFPKEVRGVPSSIFNGQPKAGGGGGLANAESKYDAYRQVIDPLLEDSAGAKISLQAIRKGDAIEIFAKVSDLTGPGADKKLRILLTEETVRYPGSNKIRLHHNVVRAMPGGVDGFALTEAASRHKASVNLPALRGSLVKYLDNYQNTVRPFSHPSRPLDMSHLRVVAFVQDDATREILQAAQVEVK